MPGRLELALKLGYPRFSGSQLALKLIVLGRYRPHRQGHLVKEIINLDLVITLTELRGLKTLQYHIVGCQLRHLST
jgi:hypothetical protein